MEDQIITLGLANMVAELAAYRDYSNDEAIAEILAWISDQDYGGVVTAAQLEELASQYATG